MINSLGRWRPVAEIFGIASVFAVLNFLMLRWFAVDTAVFVYSVFELYGYFFAASVIILIALVIVERKNLDYVGYSFLIATSVKMVFAYLLLRPVLEQNLKIEKINFFFVFALFLTLETITTGRMLNRK